LWIVCLGVSEQILTGKVARYEASTGMETISQTFRKLLDIEVLIKVLKTIGKCAEGKP